MFKKSLIFLLLGALAGILLASWIVPPTLSWYAEPGGLPNSAQVQSLVPIPEIIRYATRKLILWQAISASIGGALGLFLAIVTRKRPDISDEHEGHGHTHE